MHLPLGRTTNRPWLAAATLATVAMVAASCSGAGSPKVTGTSTGDPASTSTSSVSASTSTSTGGSTSTTAGAGATVEAATWRTCPTDATLECATVAMPRVYGDATKGVINVKMARIKAAQPSRRIGSLFLNPGGPGGSGIEFLPDIAKKLPKALKDRFDLIGFDPRGVGQSDPITCLPEKDRVNALDQDPDDPTEEQALIDAQKLQASACQKDVGTKLSSYGTAAAARDLDRLRQAVGDDHLTYLGFSYGTYLGSVYATLFPDKARALVLDGAVDPTLDDGGLRQAQGFELAFQRFATACATSPACTAKPDARALYDQDKTKVEAKPVPTADAKRPLTSGSMLTGVAAALYSQRSWPILALGLADVAAGNGQLLLAMGDNQNDRKGNGSYGNISDAFRVIGCDDEKLRPTVAEARADAAEFATKAPLLGAAQGWGNISCQGFPQADEAVPTVSAPTVATPIVVIGTKGDPATPFENTAKLASVLGKAVTVSWDGDGHTATTKSPCVDAAVSDYLIDLKVPVDGLECSGTYDTKPADPFVLDRTDFAATLQRELTNQTNATRGPCLANGLLKAFNDTQLLHFFFGVDDPTVVAITNDVVATCPA